MNTNPNTQLVLRATAAAVLIPLLFVAAFIIPSHAPKANDLPIAVAGSAATAQPLLRSLGDVSVIRVADASAARDAVRDRAAYAAIITAPRPTVEVASGESFVAATLLKQDAIRAGISPTQVKDVAPLPSGDPRNTTLNLVALALLVAGIIGATAVVVTMRGFRPGRPEAVLAGVALTAGAGATGLLKAYSALPGPFAVEAALFAAFIFAVSLFASGLVRLKGQVGTSLSFLLFLVVANPGSGLATAPDLLPDPWRHFGQLTPPGAWGQAVRGTAYFGSAADLGPILVLTAWIALGASLVALSYRRVRPASPPAGAPTEGTVPPATHRGPRSTAGNTQRPPRRLARRLREGSWS